MDSASDEGRREPSEGEGQLGPRGAMCVAVGAAWILLESHLPGEAAGMGVSFFLNRGKSPDLIGSCPPVCDNQLVMATDSLGALPDSGSWDSVSSWASGTNSGVQMGGRFVRRVWLSFHL